MVQRWVRTEGWSSDWAIVATMAWPAAPHAVACWARRRKEMMLLSRRRRRFMVGWMDEVEVEVVDGGVRDREVSVSLSDSPHDINVQRVTHGPGSKQLKPATTSSKPKHTSTTMRERWCRTDVITRAA